MERKFQVKKEQSHSLFVFSTTAACTGGDDETSQWCDPAVEEISGTIVPDPTRHQIGL